MATKKQTAEDVEVMEQTAEELEKNNVDITGIEAAAGKVYVFANLPTGQRFKLKSGREVEISGLPVSRLIKPGGGSFSGGKYAVTAMDADDWKEVVRTYGKMSMFKNRIIFAAGTPEEGQALARGLGGLRSGFEPVDPEKAKTQPKSDKE